MKFEQVSFAIIGGDLRQVKLCNHLISHGYKVSVFGFSNVPIHSAAKNCETLEDAIHCSDIIIGPIPCSQNDNDLFTRYYEKKVTVESVLKIMNHNQVFMAGRLTETIQKLLLQYGIKSIDFLERDEMAIRNAIPTAEGAIQYAMQNSEITLHGSKCIVLGFGRCGKVLAHMLKGIGAHVSVEARSQTDLAYIESYGYSPIHLSGISKCIGEYDFIFNTIPTMILDAKKLEKVSKTSLIIELASKPGGIDFDAAKRLGIQTIDAQSLPGKVAPETAAKIIFDTILNAYSEMGVIL